MYGSGLLKDIVCFNYEHYALKHGITDEDFVENQINELTNYELLGVISMALNEIIKNVPNIPWSD